MDTRIWVFFYHNVIQGFLILDLAYLPTQKKSLSLVTASIECNSQRCVHRSWERYSICMPPRSDEGNELPWSAFMTWVASSTPCQNKYDAYINATKRQMKFDISSIIKHSAVYLKISKSNWHSTSSTNLQGVESRVPGNKTNMCY